MRANLETRGYLHRRRGTGMSVILIACVISTLASAPPVWWLSAVNAEAAINGTDRPIGKSLAQRNSAISSLPANYSPGTALTVSIAVAPSSDAISYVVEDQPPSGWTVSNVNQAGLFDSNNRKVKWGPYFDNIPRTLSYQVTPPSSASGTVQFTGIASFDGTDVAITGQRSTTAEIAPPPVPTVTLTVTDANGSEPGSDTGAFTISRTGGVAAPLTVNLSVSGSASNGSDYVTVPSSIVIQAGANSAALILTPLDDALVEGSETVVISLGTSSAYQIGNPATGTVIIADNDSAPASDPSGQPSQGSSAVSTLPATYTPGLPLTVSVAVMPASGATSYVVEDQPPSSWTVSNVSDSGLFDGNNRKVKWGPFFDNTPRNLSYQVTPPSSASGAASFTGIASIDGVNVSITGQRNTAAQIAGGNQLPIISSISDRQTPKNTDTDPPISFMVNDAETPPGSLTITATSDNPILVPNGSSNIQFSGSGSERLMIIRPVPNQVGVANITVTVTDQANNKATTTFKLTVLGSPPTIGQIATQSILKGGSTGALPFTIQDTESFPGFLQLSVDSSNKSLVPNSGVVLGGNVNSSSRTVTVTPMPDQAGETTITITATDPDKQSASTSFKVIVTSPQFSITSFAGPNGSMTPSGRITKHAGENQVFTATPSTGFEVDKWTVAGREAQAGGNSYTVRDIQADTTVSVTFKLPTITPLVFQSTAAITIRDTATAQPYPSTINVSSVNGPVGGVTVMLNGLSHTYTRDLTVLLTGPGGQNVMLMRKAGAKRTTGAAVSNVNLTFSDGATALVPSNAQINSGTYRPSDHAAGPSLPAPAPASPYGTSLSVFAGQNPNGVWSLFLADTELEDTGTFASGWSLTFVQSGNTPPTISQIGNQTIPAGSTTSSLVFTVTDAETSVGSLAVTASSSNKTLVPEGSVMLGGIGGLRTVAIKPAAGQSGASTITLTVSDTDGLSASTSFSLTVTPIVAGTAAKGDFNRDGRPDIVYVDRDGFAAVWFMDGLRLLSAELLEPSHIGDVAYQVVTSADLNGDRHEDLVFQHHDGTLTVWYMDGTRSARAAVLDPSRPAHANWRLATAADLNSDGKPDLVLQDVSSPDGTIEVWIMDGIRRRERAFLTPRAPGTPGWRVVGAGDFNADGKADLVFQNAEGDLAVWYLNNLSAAGVLLKPSNSGGFNWRVVSVADRNQDDQPDLLFQNNKDGELVAWLMNGINRNNAQALNPSNPGGTWRVVAP